MEIEEKLIDLFDKTVDEFITNAIGKEGELSAHQISSSFLYSSACYSGRYASSL